MEELIKKDLVTSGKAKSLYETSNEDLYILHYRNDTSAFDGKKIESLEGKGAINNKFNAFVMKHLEENGVSTHFETQISDTESVVKKLEMTPIECVVRNIAAGSICKRLGVQEGLELDPHTFEFFYKVPILFQSVFKKFWSLLLPRLASKPSQGKLLGLREELK